MQNTDTTNTAGTKDEIALLADYFSLLDKIDKRLQKEDPEYRALYYPKESNNAN